ncbi:MAG: hypothetical protein NC122_02300 [Faecalibacterium sp.]|nr:hypothetical protein [Ruminococcus sp.]MCM1391602.1 hypothetical protein [Ruminococcus sp.]MCM1485014.1 hypothetical protein [Faecalibacterium sp.]
MNKKKSVAIVTVIIVAIIAVAAVVTMKNVSKSSSELDMILNSELTVAEKSNEIGKLADSKKSECEKMKKQISELLADLCKDDVVSNYITADKAVESFDDYYSEAIDKIESKLEFLKNSNAIEYGSGSYASIAIASDEFNEFSSLYDELTDIYNNLKEMV